QQTLADLAECLGEDGVGEVVDAFHHGAEQFDEEWRECLRSRDLDAARGLVHRLIGSAGAVGACELVDVCRAAEAALNGHDSLDDEAIRALPLDRLERALDLTREALDRHLAEPLRAVG
ncbi:MAG: Hpt domain-containing protein, partial [Planctomycetes bacterium]|nr:Hpt domain-containing protein [Planctomycetota bacterium]